MNGVTITTTWIVVLGAKVTNTSIILLQLPHYLFDVAHYKRVIYKVAKLNSFLSTWISFFSFLLIID